jgi:uncharacterized membrane protein YciS (DUF1049 family)
MTRKLITSEFAISTLLAIILAVGLSFGAVYLTNKFLFPADASKADGVGF